MTTASEPLEMSEHGKVEQFRAELYMRALDELRPVLESATDDLITAHLAVREALGTLTRVRKEVERLDILTDQDTGAPMRHLMEAITVDALVQKFERETFVYLIEAGDYIKIGYSRDPISRLVQIRKGQGTKLPEGLDPSKARILTVELGTQSHEKWLHAKFADHRVAGEWFEKNERLTHYIQSIATPA